VKVKGSPQKGKGEGKRKRKAQKSTLLTVQGGGGNKNQSNGIKKKDNKILQAIRRLRGICSPGVRKDIKTTQVNELMGGREERG